MRDGGLSVALLGHASAERPSTYCYGLWRLAAQIARDGPPCDVKVLDRRTTDGEDDDLRLLEDAAPDVIGLSAYLWNQPRLARLVTRLRERLPRALVVAGGPSAAAFPPPGAPGSPDHVLAGEGEEILPALLRRQAHGPGSGSGFQCAALALVEDLGRLASPYLAGTCSPPGRRIYLETSRGCLHRCAFCIAGGRRRGVRFFPLEVVERELRFALDGGHTLVDVCDAALNYDTAHLEALTDVARRLDPGRTLEFTFALHADHLDDTQVRLISRLRIDGVAVGLNTIDRAASATVGRRIDPGRFAAAIERLASVVRPSVTVILGLPGDTPDGFARTLDFCARLPANIEIFELRVIPESIFASRTSELGIVLDSDGGLVRTASADGDALERMRALASRFRAAAAKPPSQAATGGPAASPVAEIDGTQRAVLGLLAAAGVVEGALLRSGRWRVGTRTVGPDPATVTVNLVADDGARLEVLARPRSDRVSYSKTADLDLAYHRSTFGAEPSPSALLALRAVHDLLLAAEASRRNERA